jgi:hypothetical protein
MATRLVTLATFPSPVEAALARNILAEAGIRAEGVEDSTAWALSGMFGGVKLLVDEADLDRAGELLDAALGAPLEAEDEPPDERDDVPASDFAENLADRSPADDAAAWTCLSCGVRVGADERRCWSCGASREGEANPYYVRPESAVAPPPTATKAAPHEPPEHVRDWIDRGWRAACFSAILLPPLFNFYSAWLLLRAAGEATDLPPSYNRKFYGAFAINLIVTGLSILIWVLILRDAWVIDLLPLV